MQNNNNNKRNRFENDEVLPSSPFLKDRNKKQRIISNDNGHPLLGLSTDQISGRQPVEDRYLFLEEENPTANGIIEKIYMQPRNSIFTTSSVGGYNISFDVVMDRLEIHRHEANTKYRDAEQMLGEFNAKRIDLAEKVKGANLDFEVAKAKYEKAKEAKGQIEGLYYLCLDFSEQKKDEMVEASSWPLLLTFIFNSVECQI